MTSSSSSDQIIYSGFSSSENNNVSNTSSSSLVDEIDPKTIKNVDWSIDVVLATNTLQQPSANGVPIVNLTLTLSDDTIINRRLTTSELHKWRYTLARATKDLQVISSRQPPPEKKLGGGKKK